jgi:wobble nucleotide-excising tRNase
MYDHNTSHRRHFRFAGGKCIKCDWIGHGVRFGNDKFVCSYCDPASATRAAAEQKEFWLKGGYIKWQRAIVT